MRYAWAILHREGRLWERFSRLYPRLAGRIEESLALNTCPFCGRQFSTWTGLAKHVLHGRCSRALAGFIHAVKMGLGEEELSLMLTA